MDTQLPQRHTRPMEERHLAVCADLGHVCDERERIRRRATLHTGREGSKKRYERSGARHLQPNPSPPLPRAGPSGAVSPVASEQRVADSPPYPPLGVGNEWEGRGGVTGRQWAEVSRRAAASVSRVHASATNAYTPQTDGGERTAPSRSELKRNRCINCARMVVGMSSGGGAGGDGGGDGGQSAESEQPTCHSIQGR
eukprot:scaffold10459_cov132-Isochrysis_galbana.AAC.4